ncbi:MAG: lactonase family protein [Clostridia bacterium]|nr:lactonase family protein [Clostridia bacterium]
MNYLYCGAWSFKMPVSGISAFSLQDGQWEKLGCFGAEIPAQSILAAQGGTLLSVSERRDGGSLLRYRIAEDGALSLIGRLDFDTPLMSYVCLSPDGRYAFTSSMGNSSVKMIRLESDGALTLTDEWLLTGHSVTNRQEKAKTHSVKVSPDGSLLAAANLGADELELFRIDYEKETLRLIQSVPVDFGRQPRHMAFHPSGEYLYLLTEAGNRVYVYRLKNGRLTELAAYNTLDPEKKPEGMAADITVSADGAFLYATNRAQNNIAVWRTLKSGLLDLVGHYDCGGEGPRGIDLSPDGKVLFCANNDSGDVSILALNEKTGAPEGIIQTLDVPSAACVRSI